MATNLSLSGLASGFDWSTFISQMMQVERVPVTRLQSEQTTINEKNNVLGSIVTELNVLKNKTDVLKEASFFDSRSTKVGDSTVASASAGTTASLGLYKFNFTQLATATSLLGANDVGVRLSATDDVSGLVLSNAAFGSAITAGTFTVNGKQVTIATSDTLGQVFQKISDATQGSVTASYSSTTDQITLQSSGQIILGSATDTSNFLQAAKLYNNLDGSAPVSSRTALGAANLTANLASANLDVGFSTNGEFKVNGVSITWDSSTDTIASVLKRINDSNAGVTASYDAVNDRFRLTNKTTGGMGIALEEVSGEFLDATGLLRDTGTTLARGKNLLYTINGGPELISSSNTIGAESSNIAGLTVTAFKEAETTVEVASDSGKIKTAIKDFVEQYNKVQALIDTQTASSTDEKGKVTAALLANDSDVDNLASTLRNMVNATVTAVSGVGWRLDSLGIKSNGNDNKLAFDDESLLDAALAGNLNSVRDLFTNATDGLVAKLSEYIDRTSGDDGTLITRQTNLTRQSKEIDQQISGLERMLAVTEQQMRENFIAMEKAQASINQQLSYLTKQFS